LAFTHWKLSWRRKNSKPCK